MLPGKLLLKLASTFVLRLLLVKGEWERSVRAKVRRLSRLSESLRFCFFFFSP